MINRLLRAVFISNSFAFAIVRNEPRALLGTRSALAHERTRLPLVSIRPAAHLSKTT
jgi:hypothetical protein